MNALVPEAPTGIDLQHPQRQSLWAVVFLAFRTLRSIGLVQILLFVGFVIARLPSVVALVGLVAVIGIALFAIAALQWWRFTFAIVREELVVRRGVVEQQRLSIPLDRVQSVSLEQKLLHRVVSLVQISLETAGTEAAEFVIDAVDQRTAQALQHTISNYRRPPSSSNEDGTAGGTAAVGIGDGPAGVPPAPERILVRHDPRRVVQVALTQMPFAGLLVLGPLLAIGDDLGRFIPFDLPAFDASIGTGWLLWFVPLMLVIFLLASLLLNLIRVLLTDWNLTVRASTAGLRRDAGLFSTTSVATTLPRIQIVRTRQGVLERIWDLHTVQLATIGSTNMAIAGCSSEHVRDLTDVALIGSPVLEDLPERVASAEVFLRTRNATVFTGVVATALYFVVGWWCVLPLVAVPLVWARSRRQVRLRRWALGHETIAQYQAFLGWHRDDVLIRKVNGVTVAQRLFERKRDLATVTFSTAAGNMSIGMIPLAKAEMIRDQVLLAVETDHRTWM